MPVQPANPVLQRADSYDFDPMDVTKIWPEDLFPLQPVGRMVLNRWVALQLYLCAAAVGI